MPNQNLGELFTQVMDKIENTISDINIHTKTLEGATIEIENVDMSSDYPQEKDIDTTLLREGPAIVEIGEYTWEVMFEYNSFQNGYMYFDEESGFGIALLGGSQESTGIPKDSINNSEPAIVIMDQEHTYNELQTVRIIYPTTTRLYSTGNNLYLGTDENGNNGAKVIPLPTPPLIDDTYTLQCTVSSGVATYSWVSLPIGDKVNL